MLALLSAPATRHSLSAFATAHWHDHPDSQHLSQDPEADPADISSSLASPAEAATNGAEPRPLSRPRASVKVGETVSAQEMHEVTRPGLYGLGQAPKGNRYGVIDGKLVRYDPESGQVLSIIRAVDAIHD